MAARSHICGWIGIAALCGIRVVMAQQVSSDAGLVEIIVTAEKRETNLQKTPAAIDVLSPTDLTDAGVRDFTNIDKVVPTVQVFQNTGSTVISIRGLRSTSFDPTDESPNAVFLDGVYISRQNALNGFFYDLQRVEVLTGPQGTLYGRNSASGAINVITNRPTSDFSGAGSIESGNYHLLRIEGAVNLPLSDTLAVRFAGNSYQHDGYMKSGLDDARTTGGRFEGLWNPDEHQSLFVSTDLEHVDPRGPGNTIIGVTPTLQGANKFTVPSNVRDDTQIDGTDNRGALDQTVWGTSAQYDYKWDGADITVQYAHRAFDQAYRVTTLYTDSTTPEHSLTNSVETRITSNSASQLQYVAGLFYFNEKANGFTESFVSPTVPVLASIIDLEGQKTDAAAAFGQATWTPEALSALHLTLGGRYNYDKKSASSHETIVPVVNFVSPFQTKSWDKITWKADISYDLTSTSLLYVDVSTGYKSGGFTYGATPVTPPQTITAYAVGSKNRFFSEHLQVNLEAFKYDYKNFEQTFLDTRTFPFVLNVATAGSANISGVDLTTLFEITRHDNMHLDVSYLQTSYGAFNLAAITGIPNQPNLTGFPLPNTPRWDGTVGYTHEFDFGPGTLAANADMQVGGARPVTLPSSSSPIEVHQGGYAIIDLSVRYQPRDAKWNATAYCNNIADRYYLYSAAINTSGPESGTTTATISPPRTFGVIVRTKF